MSKFQGVLKMFMLGVLKTISKTMLKYEKNTITLYGTCWNWAADFVFLLRFCTSNWSETYTITVVMWVLTDIRRRFKALSSSVVKEEYVHRNQANIYCNILIGELLLFSRRWKSFSQLWQISHRICLKLAACVKNVCSICALKHQLNLWWVANWNVWEKSKRSYWEICSPPKLYWRCGGVEVRDTPRISICTEAL